ncbi:MAG: glycoside hydrolase family 97 catalytic domain-containing protein, partial [Gemmatimonadaceae bacterium]
MSNSSRRNFIISAQAAIIAATLPIERLFASETDNKSRTLKTDESGKGGNVSGQVRASALHVQTLRSPGANLTVLVGVNSARRLWYSIEEGGIEVLPSSPLGLTIDGLDLGQGTKILGQPSIREIDESYSLYGNHARARNHAKEMVVSLQTADKTFALVVRAYDDGAAVRYLLPEGATHIDGESTGWQLPEQIRKIVWEENNASYEGLSHSSNLSRFPEETTVLAPIMVETDHHYFSISEADCESFSDMSIKRHGNLLQAEFGMEPQGWDIQASIKDDRTSVLHGTYLERPASPWRSTVVTRDLTALVNSDLLTNLCPPPSPHLSFDWVEPGRSLWSWWSVGYPPYSETSSWYDAAAQLKWEYYLIDAGWIKWKTPDKDHWAMLKDISDYGKGVGVKTLVWGQYKEMPTPNERRAWLEKAKASGVSGVKLDFPPKATASVMNWWYLGTLQDCAELKLLVDFHGSVKPTGLERTYPNGITREAVRGNEYNIKRYKRVAPASEDVTLPFGRLLAGPADFTPVILDPDELSPSGFTWCHEFAQAIIVLSPIAVFADH